MRHDWLGPEASLRNAIQPTEAQRLTGELPSAFWWTFRCTKCGKPVWIQEEADLKRTGCPGKFVLHLDRLDVIG